MAEMSRRKPILANRPPLEIEARIVVPLAGSGFPISCARGVYRFRRPPCAASASPWSRNETMKKRLKVLEAKVAQEGLILNRGGKPRSQGAGVPAPRLNPSHAQKVL